MLGQMSIYDLMKRTCDTCVNFRPVYGYEDEDFRACFVDVISKSNDPDKKIERQQWRDDDLIAARKEGKNVNEND